MKNLCTLFIVMIFCQSVFATATSSGNWRWRNDDGDDAGKATVPTWKAAENTPITINSTVQHIRLRVTNYSGSQTGTSTPQLRYSSTDNTPSAASSSAIPDAGSASSSDAFVMVASSYVTTNGQSSPTQISDAAGAPSYNSFSGAIYTTTNGPGSQTEIQNRKYEAEFDFVPYTGIKTGTTYYFVLSAGGQVPGTVLSGYPSLTTSTVLPITLTNFSVIVDANGNEQITWATSSETNSSSYVIESSIDGSNFSPIATVASKNSVAGAAYTYNYTKGLPTGINYFRLKAIDKDGSFTYSSIQLVNITSGVSKITIAPNPVLSTLNITGVQQGSYVQVFNINAQKILTAVATGASLQKINVSILTHGAYYVQIVNSGKVVANQLIIKQ